MNKQSNYTELKAIVQIISKYIENVNPNTPYQQNLKRDIKHIINVLDEDNIESWITCIKNILFLCSTEFLLHKIAIITSYAPMLTKQMLSH